MSEDFYKHLSKRKVSSRELLWVSRISVVFIAFVGLVIAFYKLSTIYQLVLYAWSGLGASFGPLVLLSLYSKKMNTQGAFVGILVGGLAAAIWLYFDGEVAPIVPSFFLSVIAIQLVSYITHKRGVRFVPKPLK